MANNETEKIVSEINSNIFFREFTFSKNDFKELNTNQKLEFADSVVWIDEILFIYQIKERNSTEKNDLKWFENKVLNKGVKQVKNTLYYLKEFRGIEIENEKGHKLDISETRFQNLKKIIIYNPSKEFPEQLRFHKFYDSSDIGLIHLFHLEDYYWICKYLITPAEIEEYLTFREEFYHHMKKEIEQLPEQYMLGHFLETLDADHINPKYIENLKTNHDNSQDFDISFLIENFNREMKLTSGPTEYYPIIKEIAKLNRAELKEFRKRFILTIKRCNESEPVIPFRVYFPRTNCAFVFIPLGEKYSHHWKTALSNYTLAQKYDQKSDKCVGLVIYEREINGKKYFEMFWEFIEAPWEFNAKVELLLKENFPFRDAKMTRLDNRYKSS